MIVPCGYGFFIFIFVTIIKIKIYSKRRQAFDNKNKKSKWFAWLVGAHKTLIAKQILVPMRLNDEGL
jgi:hypothetical protein